MEPLRLRAAGLPHEFELLGRFNAFGRGFHAEIGTQGGDHRPHLTKRDPHGPYSIRAWRSLMAAVWLGSIPEAMARYTLA